MPIVKMGEKDLAIRHIREADNALKGMIGIMAPVAWIRSWPMQGNLKIAARVAKISPKIARAQLSITEKTTGVWKNVARETHDRDLFGTSKAHIEHARELLKEEPEVRK